jgi:hypothetical protein
MNTHLRCIKIPLAGNDGCRISYCETHQIAELEIGALSLRLDIEAFTTLSDLINEANDKITKIQASKQSLNAFMSKLKDAH